MKKISPALVLVKNIHSSRSCGKFSETELERAAKLILAVEGVINPPILLRTGGLDSYEIIEGHFEYCAALKAKEMNPRKGESINAYIVESEAEELVFRKQIEVFRTARSEKLAVEPATMIRLDAVRDHLAELDNGVNQVIEAVQNISGKIIEAVQNISGEIKELYRQLEVLEERGKTKDGNGETEIEPQPPEPIIEPQPPEPIDVLPKSAQGETKDKSEETKVEPQPPEPIIELQPPEPIESSKEQLVLTAINTLETRELAVKLKNAGVTQQKVRDNIEKERKKEPFSAFEDMKKRVKGLGKQTMDKILSYRWS